MDKGMFIKYINKLPVIEKLNYEKNQPYYFNYF